MMLMGETLAGDRRKLRAPEEVGGIPGAVGTILLYSLLYITEIVPERSEETIEAVTKVNETERETRQGRVTSGIEGLAVSQFQCPEYQGE